MDKATQDCRWCRNQRRIIGNQTFIFGVKFVEVNVLQKSPQWTGIRIGMLSVLERCLY